MTREEIYFDEFRIRRNHKTNKWWIHWAPFGIIYGSITGPFDSYAAAFDAGVEQFHEEYA